jgi:hypothetical protein
MFTNIQTESTTTHTPTAEVVESPPASFRPTRLTPEKLRSLAPPALASDPHLAALARRFVEAQKALHASGRA